MRRPVNASRPSNYCFGKVIYFDIRYARKVARLLWRHHRDAVAPYRCVRCNGFHLGSSMSRNHKPLKDR